MVSYSQIKLILDSDVRDEFDCKFLKDNQSQLSICLEGTKSLSTLTFIFDFYYCYTKSNESYRIRTHQEFPKGRYLLLKAENSDEVEWFHAESGSIYREDTVYHFLIVSSDDVIDVLTNQVPKLYFAEKNSEDRKEIPVPL